MNRRLALISASLMTLTALACSASVSPGPGDGGSTCQDLATSYCAWYQGCSPSNFTRAYGSGSTCQSQQAASCALSLSAPGSSRSAATVEACAQGYADAGCADFFSGNLPDTCVPTAGTVADGGVCVNSFQCQTTFCELPVNGTCGVCQPLLQPGASCATVGCGRGMICGNDTKTCILVQQDGGACHDTNGCGAELTCFGFDGGNGSGTCVPATSGTNACDFRDLTSPNCDTRNGYECISSVCIPDLLADAGEACGRIDAGPPACDAGTTCIVPGPIGCQSGAACVSNAGSATCVAPAATGAACDVQLGPDCLAPAKCAIDAGTHGLCQLADPALCPG